MRYIIDADREWEKTVIEWREIERIRRQNQQPIIEVD